MLSSALQSMFGGEMAGRSSGKQEYLAGWLPPLEFKSLINSPEEMTLFKTTRNIFPMAQQFSAGNPNGIIAKIIRAMQLHTIADILKGGGEGAAAGLQNMAAQISYDDNFQASIASNVSLQMQNLPNVLPDGGGLEI